MTGNFNPSPQKFGASTESAYETILNSLMEQDGTALSKDGESIVWAENNALARALADLWSTNNKLANQWNPEKMTDFIPRWEKILGIVPGRFSTDVDRRDAIGIKLANFGKAGTQQVINDLLESILQDVYVNIVNGDFSTAIGFVPGGATIPGGATLGDGAWYSTLAYVAIKTLQPFNMNNATFYERVGQIYPFLDNFLPAWVDFNWFRNGTHGDGFFLDDENNLDNEAFD